jgi:hypothetical protein
MIFPTWKEFESRIENNEELTPLEQFIYEDMSLRDVGSFKRLGQAIDYAVEQAKEKMPTLEECQAEIQSQMWRGALACSSFTITEAVYNFIVRKLSE